MKHPLPQSPRPTWSRPRRIGTLGGIALAFLLTMTAAKAHNPQPELQLAPDASLGTAFTYQGQLRNGGAPVNATCDFEFGLWDALTLGTQVGVTQTVSSLAVTNGLFTTPIDFGTSAFDGNARWLGIAVRCPAGGGSYTLLSPRQTLTAAPFALAGGNFAAQTLNLPNTSGTAGILNLGSSRFLHNYGADNTFVGANAGNLSTTGSANTASGAAALNFNTDGNFNTASGAGALQFNTSGANNTANGSYALRYNSTGYENTANGSYALYYNTTGYQNTASGYYALEQNSTGYYNTANGWGALYANTTGTRNTSIGAYALYSNTTGSNNTANGYATLYANETGYQNAANGSYALYYNTTGSNNTANGYAALFNNTTGDANTAHGAEALRNNTTGNWNTANGNLALSNNITGYHNTATGANALQFNTAGFQNTANGANALVLNSTGSQNTAIGNSALNANTTGIQNTANGSFALFVNTTGAQNTANGASALQNNTTGSQNTANGLLALYANTTGDENTASGTGALVANTTGSANIGIGYFAGSSFAGVESRNIVIGNSGAAGDFGTIRIGSPQTRTFIAGIYGANVGGTGTTVFVNSSGQLGTTTSSRRFKDNVADMGPASDIIYKLRPVTFTYKPEYGGSPAQTQVGLIAEEVMEHAPWMVAYGADGQPYTVRYEALAPMLLNETQKQHRTIDELRKENAELAQRLAAIEKTLQANSATARADSADLPMAWLFVGGLGIIGWMLRRKHK